MLSNETKKIMNELENAVVDCVIVPASWLPESYRGKNPSRKLRSVVNEANRRKRNLFKPDREVSVKFDGDREVTTARPERLAILEKYRADIDAGREIAYDVDEDKLYRFECAWVGAMVRAGVIDAEELTDEIG